MDRKPLIAVTPAYDVKEERYFLKADYMRMLEGLGAVPMIMPLTADAAILERFLEICGGLILSGGSDIDPVYYGSRNDGLSRGILPIRDEMELALCRMAVERDLPVLGICRGHQVLNVALGGTLYQDLKTEMGTDAEHMVMNPVGGVVHAVSLAPGSPLEQIQGTQTMMVNSRHHQAVRDPAPGLEIQALSPDGVVESVYMPGKRFVWGVQWHPETIWSVSDPNRKIAEVFLRAVKEN